MAKIPVLALATIALAVSASPVLAQSRVEAGVLECRLASATSFVVGSVRNLRCVFKPAGGGPLQTYTGTARRVGIDIGVTSEAKLIWTVLAPTRTVGRGRLAGAYAGVSASAAIGYGVGANALVGGFRNSFALQPLSVEAEKGFNIALGAAGLELKYRK